MTILIAVVPWGRPTQSRLRVPIHIIIVLALVKTNANLVTQHKRISQEWIHRLTNPNLQGHLSTGVPNFLTKRKQTTPLNHPSHAAQLDASPTKNQIIIIHATDDTSLQDDALAIEKLIGPKSIRYISKISNNRICAHLDKTKLYYT